MDDNTLNGEHRHITIKLWPPSQKTRQMLVERMTNNMSTPTVFTRKYGSLTNAEAEKYGKLIEESAYSSANQHYEEEPDGDGSSAVQLYASECSRLILDVLKGGSRTENKEAINGTDDKELKPGSGDKELKPGAQDKELKPGAEDKELKPGAEDKELKPGAEDKELKPGAEDKELKPGAEDKELKPGAEDKGLKPGAEDKELKPGAEDKELKPEAEDKELKPGADSAFTETFFDISKGQRAFIEEDEARVLLCPLKQPGNCYTKICFSNRSFGLGAANVAGPILESMKDQLKDVNLSDFVAGRPEAEALDVMKIFSAALEGSNLTCLNISDNALGEKGVRAFGKLLQSQINLEELYLMNDGISKEAAQAVSELIPSTEDLRILHFHNNMTGDEGALAISDILKRSPFLEDFRCSSTRVGTEGGVALAEALGQCRNLKKLDLRDNMYGVEAGVKLSESLYKHEGLREIYLSYLNLEDDGAIAIINALKVSAPSLSVLELAGNDITAEAAPFLAACISTKMSLVKLNLSENDLKDEGAIQISKALGEGHSVLKEVDISQNSLRRAGSRAMAQALAHLPGFELLNINGNFISEEGIDELKEIFEEFPDKLGELDENDPEGEDFDDNGDEEEDSQDELELKLKNLDVNQSD